MGTHVDGSCAQRKVVYSNDVGSQKLSPTWNMMLSDERAVGVRLRLGSGRVHRRGAIRRLEVVEEDVVAHADVDGEPLREEEAHANAEVRLDEAVREARELRVARDDFALTGADAAVKYASHVIRR